MKRISQAALEMIANGEYPGSFNEAGIALAKELLLARGVIEALNKTSQIHNQYCGLLSLGLKCTCGHYALQDAREKYEEKS